MSKITLMNAHYLPATLTFGRTKVEVSDYRATIKDDVKTKINQRMDNNGRMRIKKAQLIDNNEVLGALQK
jgi:hypothetical protein